MYRVDQHILKGTIHNLVETKKAYRIKIRLTFWKAQSEKIIIVIGVCTRPNCEN